MVYPRFRTCIFKLHLLPIMWPNMVEFRSASSAGSWRKKERKKESMVKYKSTDIYVGRPNQSRSSTLCWLYIQRLFSATGRRRRSHSWAHHLTQRPSRTRVTLRWYQLQFPPRCWLVSSLPSLSSFVSDTELVSASVALLVSGETVALVCEHGYYPHMPIGMARIYRLLFFVCFLVRRTLVTW